MKTNSIDADLVVLATGQVPNAGVNSTSGPPPSPPPRAATRRRRSRRRELQKISVLNLNYRQGPDMPQFKYGFADSHFICFPYETRRTGIYAAGPTRRPMDMLQATEDATGAALKAIQAVENAARGRAAHPRAGTCPFPIGAPRGLHPVQALHGGMSLRRHRRGREALPEVSTRSAAAAAAPAWAPARCA
jgi:quinone-modifying oxidoreductase subunit QmoB